MSNTKQTSADSLRCTAHGTHMCWMCAPAGTPSADPFMNERSNYFTPREQGRDARLNGKRRFAPFMCAESNVEWLIGFDSVPSTVQP